MAAARALMESLCSANAKYNIFTSLRSEAQLQTGIDAPLKAAIKDNIATLEEATTCGSRMLEGYRSPFEATVVSLLKDSALIVGKTNMDEFGMGSGNTNSYYGPTLNPLYPQEKRVVGGSSGGSAAAVAAGVVDFALGTDTGGSVRLPAAYSGIYGFKPTYGRISRWGVIAYAQSLDTVGILSRDLDTIESIFKKLDKHDPKDPTSISDEIRSSFNSEVPSKLRIGVSKEFILDNLSSPVAAAWKEALVNLSKNHEVVPISIPTIRYALPIYYTLAPAEAASNLARYDGIRYGFRSDSDKNNYAKTRRLGFGKEVQNRIILGNFNLNADSFKNHFLKAQSLRGQLKSEFNQVFRADNSITATGGNQDGVDLLLTPTSITQAPTIEEYETQSSTDIYTNDTFTVPASLANLPAISIPWYTKESNIPVGLQLIGQAGNDNTVLQASKVVEQLNK